MIKPLFYISINNASAESLKYMNDFPSPDTLLRRLESLDLKHVVNALNSANRTILTGHARDGTKMAIDFTEEPYYGKLDMYVSKYKNGTDRFHTFATISVVGKDEKERLTLYSLPMPDTKEDIVKKLLENAQDISLDDGQRFFQNRNDKIASKHGNKLHNASS